MERKQHAFEGIWDIVALEYRVAGEWNCECRFYPGEWAMAFLPDGRYFDLYRPEDDRESGTWTIDERTEIISVELENGTGTVTVKHVFEGTDDEGWMYVSENSRHIPLDRNLIIAHHAYSRYKFVRPVI